MIYINIGIAVLSIYEANLNLTVQQRSLLHIFVQKYVLNAECKVVWFLLFGLLSWWLRNISFWEAHLDVENEQKWALYMKLGTHP